ncbi:MAG TPA: hypothetical protein VMU81_03110 [Acetobacteraceae bacterium]|jgi:hypothetical protein|nr:hypothetical protein [Acetobacteraceae bacterium]
MSNYIIKLREQVATLEVEAEEIRDRAQEFRIHFAGPKFSGTEHDGSCKDWISTAEVEQWLRHVVG